MSRRSRVSARDDSPFDNFLYHIPNSKTRHPGQAVVKTEAQSRDLPETTWDVKYRSVGKCVARTKEIPHLRIHSVRGDVRWEVFLKKTTPQTQKPRHPGQAVVITEAQSRDLPETILAVQYRCVDKCAARTKEILHLRMYSKRDDSPEVF